MAEKLKIVWLCGFTNDNIQRLLKPHRNVGMIAIWISNLIEIFENKDDFELHIISTHQYISGYKHFTNNKVHYHFVNQGLPVSGRKWPSFFPFDVWTDYYYIKKKIRMIIEAIQPDLIHMHGAENTYHSAAITQFREKFPVIISIQGFINKSRSDNYRIRRRKHREMEILRTFRHYGYRTETMGHDIQRLNRNAVLHFLRYPIKPIFPKNFEKKYDIVFFARITREKGIGDLIEALSEIKKKKPDVTMCVIGRGKINAWKDLAAEFGVSENIDWKGFIMDHTEVHDLVSASRICVLPTYHEIISGTILESLFLGVPVVAYNVGSIHEINKKDSVVTLVNKADVSGLAHSILKLLTDAVLWQEKSHLSIQRAKEMFITDEDQIRESLKKAYRQVIDDFNHSVNV